MEFRNMMFDNKLKAFIFLCFIAAMCVKASHTCASFPPDTYYLESMKSEKIVETQEKMVALYTQDLYISGCCATELEALQLAHEDIYNDSSSSNYFFSITSHNQEQLGYLWYSWTRDEYDEVANFLGEVYIQMIFLEKEFRGQGIAKKTLQDIEDNIRKQGARSMGLFVFAHNQTAYNLYKKLGYEVIKTMMHSQEAVIGYYMKKQL